jgi:hypothetical protein
MKKYYFLASALVLSLIAGPVVAAGVSVGTSANVGVGVNTNIGVSAGSSSPLPTLQIINPNGHEFFSMDLPIRIKWTASSNFGNVKIEWREPIINGRSGTIAVVPADKGFYDWTPTADIGVLPADSYSIYIYSVDKPQTVRTNSLYPFSIKASASQIPVINLKSPKGNEVWRRGETKFISWVTSNVPNTAFVNIRLVDVVSGKVSEIVTRAPNTGSATWKVEKRKNLSTNLDELIPYGKYKVRACIAGVLGGCDKTGGDVNIEIRPASDGLAASVINAIRSLFGL